MLQARGHGPSVGFSNALQSPVLADDLGQARFLPDPILGILLRS